MHCRSSAGGPLPGRTFTATYVDTADRRLLRAGITLRRRVENRAGLWHLELPSDDGRFELEARGGPAKPPPAFIDLLAASLRGGATLEPVARLRTRRDGVAVGPRANRVEVVVDTVTVVGARSRWTEVGAEAVSGDGARLTAIGKTLRKAGAVPTTSSSKLDARPRHAACPPEESDAIGRLRALLVKQYDAILTNDPGVRIGQDIEALHQLRVATRRSRALLRAGRGLVASGWAEPLRAELKWLGGLLGPVRDLDVLLEHLDSEAATLEQDDARAFRRLRARLVSSGPATATCCSKRCAASATFGSSMGSREPQRPRRASSRSRWPRSPERRSRGCGRPLRRCRCVPADDELHAVRIETKRARYAAELAAPDLGKKGARFLDRAKELQDVIGDHQDAVVAEGRLRELALRGGGKTGLAAGRLVERQRQRKREARRAYPAAWSRLEKAGRKTFS